MQIIILRSFFVFHVCDFAISSYKIQIEWQFSCFIHPICDIFLLIQLDEIEDPPLACTLGPIYFPIQVYHDNS